MDQGLNHGRRGLGLHWLLPTACMSCRSPSGTVGTNRAAPDFFGFFRDCFMVKPGAVGETMKISILISLLSKKFCLLPSAFHLVSVVGVMSNAPAYLYSASNVTVPPTD